MLPHFEGGIMFWKVPRHRPFALLITGMCRCSMENLWNNADRGEQNYYEKKTDPSATRLKTKDSQNYSPYRAVNTPRLGYTNHSVNAV
jgi:hypothetical protein